ncbi:hypothetical protein FIBSPDRAFT_894956 [Athelia psychrophila]|uniref:Uncharacterized protein n=1 Tax=Athelia psychrophila TaxID=1759441 RepID=A0A166F7P7_9AGAM|nr:hypothetical protein FIBSPDRAFT_894956 [Fibularhizoctonia sp. CBS 109695]
MLLGAIQGTAKCCGHFALMCSVAGAHALISNVARINVMLNTTGEYIWGGAASAASVCARKLVVRAVRAWGLGSGHEGCWVSRGHCGWVGVRVGASTGGVRQDRACGWIQAGWLRASMGTGCGLGAGCIHIWGLGADWARAGDWGWERRCGLGAQMWAG